MASRGGEGTKGGRRGLFQERAHRLRLAKERCVHHCVFDRLGSFEVVVDMVGVKILRLDESIWQKVGKGNLHMYGDKTTAEGNSYARKIGR